jgi:hypothetical protein
LISTDTFQGRSLLYQVPRRREYFGVAQGLPEFDVEIPVSRVPAHQSFHDDTISHLLYYGSVD